MKTLHEVLGFIAVLAVAATGNTALAADAPKPVVASQATGTGQASEGPVITVKVPIFASQADNVPLAMVNDEPVTLGDLTAALGSAHETQDPAKKVSGGKIDYDKILERLINVRLAVQEATKIGFDELPEFKSAVEDYSTNAQAEQLMREVTKDVKADPVAVEKLYKEMAVEWKIKSIFFEKEEDAKGMAEALKAGTSYEELAKKAIAEKKAKGFDEAGFVKPKDLSAHIMETVATMETGSVSPIVKVQSGQTMGFTIMKLEEKRYPEDSTMREQAERSVLATKKSDAWEEYKASLVKKYVKINDKTLNGLDYEANFKKKFPEMLKDKRVIADIKGEKPITVGDLTQEIANQFWHGPEEAAKSKKLNKAKRPTLFLMVGKRVIAKDVLNRGIDKSEEYLKGLKAFKDSTLFGLLVERVIVPDVNVTEADVKAYFAEHQKEYQYPEMMKISSLAFKSKRDAESALKTLKKGSDINWVRSNTDGIVAKDEEDPLTSLSGSILSLNSMPPGMAKAVAGARAGDYRIYEGGEGRCYVLSIDDAIPPRPQPYEEVREPISEKVFNEKFVKSMEDWFQKLRSASSVKLYFADTGK